jgi:hypothetical protein
MSPLAQAGDRRWPCPPGPKSASKRSSRDVANSPAARSALVGHLGPDRSITRSSRTAHRGRSIRFRSNRFLRGASDEHSTANDRLSGHVARSAAPRPLRAPHGRQRSPDEPKAERKHDISEAGVPESSRSRVVHRQNQTRHVRCPLYAKQKRAPRTSATQRPQRPPMSKLRSCEPGFRKTHSSAGSSPSASRSGLPARICSAIRPEFWRIAASILAVMSGLALRNAFEFSRPCPSLWLS